MPSGIYKRTEKHFEICRKGGLASPTKFKKGHKVPKEWREILSKKNTGYKHTKEAIEKIAKHSRGKNNPAWKGGKEGYYRRIARKIKGTEYNGGDIIVHHIDGNVKNNDPKNLQVVTRSEHSKIHWPNGFGQGVV